MNYKKLHELFQLLIKNSLNTVTFKCYPKMGHASIGLL